MELPRLNDQELKWCRQMAVEEYRRKGDKGQNITAFSGAELVEIREKAKRAEYSAAKFFGFEKPNSIDVWSGPDVGHWLQVRWTPNPKENLLIPRKTMKVGEGFRNPRSYAYFLLGGGGSIFHAVGWIGGDKIFSRPMKDLGYGPTFFVPKEELSQDWKTLTLIAQSGPI